MPGARVERGDRIALRTVEQEDAPFLQRAYANPALRDPLGRRVRTVQEVEQRIAELAAEDDHLQLLACLDDDDAPPGTPDDDVVTPVGLVLARRVTYRPNLAFWIAPEHHGEGYGTAAASLVVDLLFRRYDVPSVGAGVYDFNDASKALLESLGFTREGRQRKVQFHDGAYHDNLKYGLLREEWDGAPQ